MHMTSSPKWESFSVEEIHKANCGFIGFGSLASIIRTIVSLMRIRRKVASIVQLACAEKMGGIRSVLSVT